MRHTSKLAWLLLPLAMLGCQRTQPTNATGQVSAASSGNARHEWLLPSSPGASEPDLVATPDGRLLLSWIDNVPGRRNALQFAAWGSDDHWQSAPRTIVVGASLFTDAANIPHIATTTDGALWVHWLQKTGGVGEAADVMLSRSADGGFNWSPPARVNTAVGSSAAGFAALWPASRSSLGIAWLDGREISSQSMPVQRMSPAPPTSALRVVNATVLRAAVFDAELRRNAASDVDAMVCDCCQSDVAMTTRGALLVYRDRTPEEIRDIAATRFDGTHWSAPKSVHADGWKMPACPVNGPAVAANGNDVVVAWYTAAGPSTGSGQAPSTGSGQGMPTVLLARSTDAGDTFAAPVVLEQGEAVQGRVAVALDAQQAWVLWVREDASGQSLWLARYAPDLSRQLQRVEVAKLQGRGRATGFPQLALRSGGAYIVWTDVIDGAPQLHGARFAR